MWQGLSVVLLLFVGSAFGVTDPRCPANINDMGFDVKYFQGKCYQFVKNLKYWAPASDWCNQKGGYLATVDSQPTQKFLYDSLRSLKWPEDTVWIGAHRRRTGGVWVWSDGKQVSYTNWAFGEPDNSNIIDEEECVQMRLDDSGQWHDACCACIALQETYICMYDPVSDPTATIGPLTNKPVSKTTALVDPRCPIQSVGSPWVVKYYNGKCYQFVTDKKLWPDARDFCKKASGQLAQIEDQVTQDYLVGAVRSLKLKQNQLWIGLNRRGKKNTDWKWDGSNAPLKYKNWADGQPDNSNLFLEQECVQMYMSEGGQWWDACCKCLTNTEPFICQYDSGSIAPATQQPKPNLNCPTKGVGSPWDVRVYQDRCYQFVGDIKRWPDARSYCQRAGGELAQIDNQETQDWLFKTLQQDLKWKEPTLWIGANRRGTGGTWQWAGSNDKLKFTYWAKGEPNNANIFLPEECVSMWITEDGNWHDECCRCVGAKENFICMYGNDIGPNTGGQGGKPGTGEKVEQKSNVGLIVGLVVGVLGIALIVAGVVGFMLFKRRAAGAAPKTAEVDNPNYVQFSSDSKS